MAGEGGRREGANAHEADRGDGPEPDPGREPGPDWEREPGSEEGREPGPGWEREPGSDWERIRQPGWSGRSEAPPAGGPPSLGSLVMLLEALRGMVPQELERQFSALLREVLLTLRALIDWYLERLDGGRDERRVEDIPIE